MNEPTNPATPATATFAMLQVVMDLFWQLEARFDALREVLCELHPEVATQLEGLIQQKIRANKDEFEKQRRMQELLQRVSQGPVQ